MIAAILGSRELPGGGTETMFRLSEPLPDRSPDRRNIVIWQRPQQAPVALGGAGYERANGSWAPAPRGSWIQCFARFTAAERALVLRETGIEVEG